MALLPHASAHNKNCAARTSTDGKPQRPVNFFDWSPSAPAVVIDLNAPGALSWLLDRYGSRNPSVLRAVLAHAYDLGAQGAVLEFRYIDADWRSEHARFYAGTFRRYPSIAHRLHFFAESIPNDAIDRQDSIGFANLGYLGYVVLRPVPAAPVGRAMLVPPATHDDAVQCTSTDIVNLFGEQLSVTGAPFVAQDAMLLRCAHATLWMVAYQQHHQFGGPRVLPADLAAATEGSGLGRSLPSEGLDLYQMTAASEAVGLPPVVYNLADPPEGETLPRLACRYLNSGLPVIVTGGQHAFVLVGYQREDTDGPAERIVFLRHDDESGPYQRVENFAFDYYSPWEFLFIPLPAKLYLPGEDAEAIGASLLDAALKNDPSAEAAQIRRRLASHEVSFRSTAMLSNTFKVDLTSRSIPEPTASMYRRMQLSRWIWVIEAVDRDARNHGRPSVLAEALVDATDHSRDLRVLATRTPTEMTLWDPDRDETRRRSGLPVLPPLRSVSPRDR